MPSDDPICITRPAVPLAERTEPHHWITDETAGEARRLWEQNRRASQIECALIAAERAIAPLVAELNAARAALTIDDEDVTP